MYQRRRVVLLTRKLLQVFSTTDATKRSAQVQAMAAVEHRRLFVLICIALFMPSSPILLRRQLKCSDVVFQTVKLRWKHSYIPNVFGFFVSSLCRTLISEPP